MGNVNINPDQSNTKVGGIVALASENLTGMRSRLVVLGNNAGKVIASLPSAATALALFLLDEAGLINEEVPLTPISSEEQVRIVAKGSGNAGAVLVLADHATAADKGKVRAVPAAEGAYFSPGIAEENFVDGQLVLVRPMPRIVNVGTAFTAAAPAATAPTNASPWGFSQAQAQAILTNLIELRAWAVANGFKS